MGEIKTSENRLDYLDIAKAIAIILVVIGHTYCNSDPPGMIVTPTSRFIYSFHMPLFFVAAGVTSHTQKEYSGALWWSTVKKNFYGLLIPYLVFALIYMPFSTENLLRILYASNVTITQSGARCVHLWYLPCLFVARMLMYGVLHLSTKFGGRQSKADETSTVGARIFCFVAMIISFAIGFLLPKLELGYPFNFDVAFVALGFIIFGYLIRYYLAEVDKKGLWLQLIIFVVALVALCLGNRYGVPSDFVMEMYCSSYGPVFWCIFNGIAGIVMVRALSSMIARIKLDGAFGWVRKSSTWLGRNTMGVYLTHQPMNILFIMPWLEGLLGIQRGCLSSGLIMSAVILAIAIAITALINRVFPQVFGKFR